MRRFTLRQLPPSSLELWYIVSFSCLLLLLGNVKLILERAGLITASDLIGQQVSTKVLWGTNWLDNFRFTAGIINLIVWGGTGLIIYSVLQSVVRGVRTMQFQRDFDSQLYVHPQGYTHQAYWKQVVVDSILGFVLLVLLVLGGVAYAFVVVPNSFIYVQRFIFEPTVRHALDPFIGLVVTFAGTTILYMLLKLVIRHHRVAAIE